MLSDADRELLYTAPEELAVKVMPKDECGEPLAHFPWATFHWTTRKEDGSIERSKPQLSKSYVIAMTDLLRVQMANAASVATTKDTGNVARNPGPVAGAFTCTDGAGTVNNGIHFGTGATAVALSDYVVETKIANGNAAGQLNYGADSISEPVTAGTTRKFTVARTVTGNAIDAVHVQNVGLIGNGGAGVWYFLLIHDVTDQTILSGAPATGTYTIGVTV